jgi:hypothetical protein
MAGTGERATRLALMQSKKETPCMDCKEEAFALEEEEEDDWDTTILDGFSGKSEVDFQ